MTAERGGGVQSLDAALRLLLALRDRAGPVALSEIARDCDMPLSKAHRYLASFLNAGLVVQAGRSGKYDLGPGAIELGLAALGRLDFVNRTADAMPDLCAATGMTVLLSVWGSQGATVVRWERAAAPLVTSMGLGTALPLLNSASGRVFLGWAPPAMIAAQLRAELARAEVTPRLAPDLPPGPEGPARLAAGIRARGFATVDGKFIPGLVAAGAPILDWQGQAQAAVTLIGTDPRSIRADAPQVAALKRFCAQHSIRGDERG